MNPSNYPPGVSGNEWQIAGPREVPDVEVTCPRCDWTGKVLVEIYDGVPWAFCGNPEPVDQDADDHGHPYNVYCANTEGGRGDGFEVVLPEMEVEPELDA